MRTQLILAAILSLSLTVVGCSDDTTEIPPPFGAECGNGILDVGEECDGSNTGGRQCADLGDFAGGMLACTSSCMFDTSGCGNCGNGTIDSGEECDGADLNMADCDSIGGNFSGGTLTCAANCTYNTTRCELCGNSSLDTGEDCDGTELDSNDCTTIGMSYTGGTLLCSTSCTFDDSGCTTCGDGNVDAGEDCDLTNLDSNDCTTIGGSYTGGNLTCDSSCNFVETDCATCGNTTIETGEDCETGDLDGNDCTTVGAYTTGTLACASCAFDVSSCTAAADVSAEIQAVLDTANGAGLALPVSGAWVTYIRGAFGSDPAGFFVQAEQMGPALFVAVDPSTLTPAPLVGDVVSFVVEELDTDIGTTRLALTISGFAVLDSGMDVSALVQDVNAVDVVTDLDDYIAELVTADVTITEDFGWAGSGHQSAMVDTTAVTANADLVLRMPDAVLAASGLVNGCSLTVEGTPMWRFQAEAQLSLWDVADATITACPAPQVLSALATAETTVVVTFDRLIDAASITDAATQFTFDNGLMASAATVSGTDVTVTTGTQTGGTDYTVTVAASVTDTLGTAVDASANTATFTGYLSAEVACDDGLDNDLDTYVDCLDLDCSGDAACDFTGQLLLWEVDSDQASTDFDEFVELWNNTGGAIDFDNDGKWFLVLVNGSDDLLYGAVQLTGTVADGGIHVVGSSTVPNVTQAEFTGSGNLQNGPDAVLLVRCDTCTDAATDFLTDDDPGTGATWTSAGGQEVTKLDAVVHHTGDSDDATLWSKVGVTAQYDERADVNGLTDSIQRVGLDMWHTKLAAPGVLGFE